jgi:hypothetical protein
MSRSGRHVKRLVAGLIGAALVNQLHGHFAGGAHRIRAF